MCKGIRIHSIEEKSAAQRCGLRPGDRIVAIDEYSVEDEIDFAFLSAHSRFCITFLRNGSFYECTMHREEGAYTGVELESIGIRRCTNKCIFCFIDQLPRGMRSSLYVKDEDYRHSFLKGTYITLTSCTDNDLDRIIEQHLSPLYISVHATDPEVRSQLLGNAKAGNIVPQLALLARHGICFHAQIVVCPGINDGAVLTDTLETLCSFTTACLSIAVVPVGLTRFHKNGLRCVTPDEAHSLVKRIEAVAQHDSIQFGTRRLFAADELLLIAGMHIPQNQYYGDYPQIENGVGLVRTLLHEWESHRPYLHAPSSGAHPDKDGHSIRYGLCTSKAAGPFLVKIAAEIEHFFPDVSLDVVSVENRFFGESVTVAGLLTARDILAAVRRYGNGWDALFLPDAMFNPRKVTLDGFSHARLQRECGLPIITASSPAQITEKLLSRNVTSDRNHE